MAIRDKNHQDPAAALPMVEAYMRWALMAAEAEIGSAALEKLLRENNLAKLIDNYPPENLKLSKDITVGDYANLCTGLTNLFGENGKNKSINIGRASTLPGIEKQGKLATLASKTALKLLPSSSQVKAVLDGIKSEIEKIYHKEGYDVDLSIEDRGDKWAYIDESCAVCAGKESDTPICGIWDGTIAESLMLLIGKDFAVEQVECRAMGEHACVWEVSKTSQK